MEHNVEDCAHHVQIEATDFKVQPSEVHILGGGEGASVGTANHRVVVHFQLDVEDNALVAKDAQSVNDAAEELPDTVTVSLFELSKRKVLFRDLALVKRLLDGRVL